MNTEEAIATIIGGPVTEERLHELVKKWSIANAKPDPRDGAPYDRAVIAEKILATARLVLLVKKFRKGGGYTKKEYHQLVDPLMKELAYLVQLHDAAEGDREGLQ